MRSSRRRLLVSFLAGLLFASPGLSESGPQPVEALATELAAATSQEAREALLAAHPDLISVPLRQALIDRASEAAKRAEYPAALEIYRLALRVAEPMQDREGMLAARRGIGLAQFYMGDNEPALAQFEKALEVAEAIADQGRIAIVLLEIAGTRFELGQLDAAAEIDRRVLGMATELGDRMLQLRALNELGSVANRRGDFDAAVSAYQDSLALCEALDAQRPKRNALHNLGQVLAARGDYQAALGMFERSLAISATMEDRFGMALTSGAIGSTWRALGNYRLAAVNLQKSLGLAEAIQSKPRIAETLSNLGLLYYSQGDDDLALHYLDQAYAVAETTGDQDATTRLLNNIGNVHRRRGDYAVALEMHQKALTLKETMGERAGVARTLAILGDDYQAQGNTAAALESWQKALAEYEAIGDKTGMAPTLGSLAELRRDQGVYDAALELALRAAATAREIDDLEDLWEALTTAGTCHRALGHAAEAEQAFDEAIDIIETLRSQVTGGQLEEPQAFQEKILPYRELVALLAGEGRLDEALACAERARSRVLLDTLQGRALSITRGMTAEEREQERRLVAALGSANRGSDEDQQQARLAHQAFRAALYAAHPELQGRRGETPAVSTADAAALLPDAGSAILEYVVARDTTWLFVLTRGSAPLLSVYPIAIAQGDLEARAGDLRRSLAQRDPGFRESAARLGNLLIGPAAQRLRDKTKWIVVPDGPLWELPFQALVADTGRYLLEDHALSYAPSIAALREMARPPEANDAETLLAMGNPSNGHGPPAQAVSIDRGVALGPLPDSEREVAELRRLYGKGHSAVYTGPAAREDLIKKEAGRYRVIHLATHGVLDNASPMYSHLVLVQDESAPPAGAAGEDGLLEAWEIMDLDLTADLVVLSACETARGRVVPGEGLIGLSWAWFVAGVPVTVVSQWKVEAKSTTELMIELHRRMLTGTSGAEALRASALKLLRGGRYRHPFYWAGFIVVGDGFRRHSP